MINKLKKKFEKHQSIKELRGSSGFTLVEMLIVMVIIAALIILIIPNISKSTEGVHEKSCDALVKTVETQMLAFKMNEGKDPTDLSELQEAGYIEEDQMTCSDGRELLYDGTGKVTAQSTENAG